MGGTEEAQVALRFLYHRAWEGLPWRRTAWRRRPGRWCLRRSARGGRRRGGLVGPEGGGGRERRGRGSGLVAKFSKEMTWAIMVNRAELTMGCGKFFSQFQTKIWVLKSRILIQIKEF
jgi:hypothetical protein